MRKNLTIITVILMAAASGVFGQTNTQQRFIPTTTSFSRQMLLYETAQQWLNALDIPNLSNPAITASDLQSASNTIYNSFVTQLQSTLSSLSTITASNPSAVMWWYQAQGLTNRLVPTNTPYVMQLGSASTNRSTDFQPAMGYSAMTNSRVAVINALDFNPATNNAPISGTNLVSGTVNSNAFDGFTISWIANLVGPGTATILRPGLLLTIVTNAAGDYTLNVVSQTNGFGNIVTHSASDFIASTTTTFPSPITAPSFTGNLNGTAANASSIGGVNAANVLGTSAASGLSHDGSALTNLQQASYTSPGVSRTNDFAHYTFAPTLQRSAMSVPPDGINDWYTVNKSYTNYQCEQNLTNFWISMVNQGYIANGYTLYCFDDWPFTTNRRANGSLIEDTNRFPSGLGNLCKNIAAPLGIKIGFYLQNRNPGTIASLAGNGAVDPGNMLAEVAFCASNYGCRYIKFDQGYFSGEPYGPAIRFNAEEMARAVQLSGQQSMIDIGIPVGISSGTNGVSGIGDEPGILGAVNLFRSGYDPNEPAYDAGDLDSLYDKPTKGRFQIGLIRLANCLHWSYLTSPGLAPANDVIPCASEWFDYGDTNLTWTRALISAAACCPSTLYPIYIPGTGDGNGHVWQYQTNAFFNPLMLSIARDPAMDGGVVIASNALPVGVTNVGTPQGWMVIKRRLGAWHSDPAPQYALCLLNCDMTNSAVVSVNFTNVPIPLGMPVLLEDAYEGTNAIVYNGISYNVGPHSAVLLRLTPQYSVSPLITGGNIVSLKKTFYPNSGGDWWYNSGDGTAQLSLIPSFYSSPITSLTLPTSSTWWHVYLPVPDYATQAVMTVRYFLEATPNLTWTNYVHDWIQNSSGTGGNAEVTNVFTLNHGFNDVVMTNNWANSSDQNRYWTLSDQPALGTAAGPTNAALVRITRVNAQFFGMPNP